MTHHALSGSNGSGFSSVADRPSRIDIDPRRPPHHLRTREGVRNALWEALFRHGRQDIRILSPSPDYRRHGIKAERRRDKLVRRCRRQIQHALADWSFVSNASVDASDLRYALDADALHEPAILAQAMIEYGARTLGVDDDAPLLPNGGPAARFTRRVRKALRPQHNSGHRRMAYGDTGEAVLQYVLAGLVDAFSPGERGAVDHCWHDVPATFQLGGYELTIKGANLHAYRNNREEFEKDALVIQGDAPDAITLFDVTTSVDRVHEKIEHERTFRKFRSAVRREGIDVHAMHVLLSEDIEGWCDIAAGEGTEMLRRMFRHELRAAIEHNVHCGVHIVALPYRGLVRQAIEETISRSSRKPFDAVAGQSAPLRMGPSWR